MAVNSAIQELRDLQEKAHLGGGEKRIARQHEAGKLTARERLDFLLDAGSFQEIGTFMTHRVDAFGLDKHKYLGDGVVAGMGRINGRRVGVFAQDFTILGGSLSEAHSMKICQMMDTAMRIGVPIIGINDSGGARIQEGPRGLVGYGEIFKRNSLASGVVPQISLILGPCAGGAVYSPGLTDFIILPQQNAYMFITGPGVIKTVTGEEVSFAELGGAEPHSTKSGVVHFAPPTEKDALELVKSLLSYLPPNMEEMPPREAPVAPAAQRMAELNELIPTNLAEPYDMREILCRVLDFESELEVQADFAPNAIVEFARLGGMTVGVVANQPAVNAGILDINAADKIARFIRFCDSFNIPIVTFVDTPGFSDEVSQARLGLVRHAAKIAYAYVEATVPQLTVVVRRAYGAGYVMMGSKGMHTDLTWAWPAAVFAASHGEERFSAIEMANQGHLDAVIEPQHTREQLCLALEMLEGKRDTMPLRKHDNIPH